MTTRTTSIVYPETDGLPLPDGEFQSPLFRRIVGDLDDRYRSVPGAKVNGNTIIYFVEGNPRRSVSPDCYVALGLSAEALESIERNNTYLLWEVGKAPDYDATLVAGLTIVRLRAAFLLAWTNLAVVYTDVCPFTLGILGAQLHPLSGASNDLPDNLVCF